MFGWFTREKRLLEIEEGKRGRWRWYARVNGKIVATSSVHGFAGRYSAKAAAMRYVRRARSYSVVYREQGE